MEVSKTKLVVKNSISGIGYRRLRSNFSRMFPIVLGGGRWVDKRLGLGIIIIFVNFHTPGKYVVRRTALNK